MTTVFHTWAYGRFIEIYTEQSQEKETVFWEEISVCALVRLRYVIGACDRVKSIILLPLMMMGHHSCLSH